MYLFYFLFREINVKKISLKNSGSLDCQFVDSHAFIVKINILNQVVVCKFVKLLEKKIIAK